MTRRYISLHRAIHYSGRLWAIQTRINIYVHGYPVVSQTRFILPPRWMPRLAKLGQDRRRIRSFKGFFFEGPLCAAACGQSDVVQAVEGITSRMTWECHVLVTQAFI